MTEEAKRYRHGKLVVALLVIACVLAPIAGTAIWINNQVTKTDRYVRTVKRSPRTRTSRRRLQTT